MSAGRNVILTGLAIAVMCLTAAAGAKRPVEQWSYFHFDGRAFVAGKSSEGAPCLATRAGMRPVVVKAGEPPPAVKLDRGTGALAGICYTQSSGGKLKPGPPYLPYAKMPVQIYAGDKLVATTETDDQGYFLATVPPGKYRVVAKEVAEIAVENGATTLVPLRVGKRMVD